MEEIDFSKIEPEYLQKMENERADYIRKILGGFLVETKSTNPIINQLRFSHGYLFLHPFLIHGQLGFKWELRPSESLKELHIAFIGVPEDLRRQGYGKGMMETMTRLADKYGYDLTLEMDSQFGMSKLILKKFYSSFGFVQNTRYSTDDALIRKCK